MAVLPSAVPGYTKYGGKPPAITQYGGTAFGGTGTNTAVVQLEA